MDEKDEFEDILNEYEDAPPEQQEKLGSRILNLAARWAAQRQATPRDAIEAAFQQAQVSQNWPEAERLVRQLIAMKESPIQSYRDWDQLSTLFELQGRMDEAYEASLESNRAARESDMRPLILNALRTEVVWAIQRNEDEQALQKIQEGLAQAQEGGSMYAPHSASFLVQYARILLKSGDLNGASARLEEADAILQPYSDSTSMTGPLTTLATWWSTTAQLRLKRFDIAGAHQANRMALEIGQRVSTFPQLEPLVQQSISHHTQQRFTQIQNEIEMATQTE
ncbi:MAG: hypothetical protein QM758_26935 [Armatimonas sp.]